MVARSVAPAGRVLAAAQSTLAAFCVAALAVDMWSSRAALLTRRTETCRFSGLRIYPGRGMKLARTDGQARSLDLSTLAGASRDAAHR